MLYRYSKKVDFVSIVQRPGNSQFPNYQFRYVPTLNCDSDNPVYSSGTSAATASFAGMSALINERLGNSASSFALEQRLIISSSNSGNPHPEYGFGYIDLNIALQ